MNIQDSRPWISHRVMYVYLLLCSDGATYVGATVDLNRRLRQHNQEIVGGARLTGSKVARGKLWKSVGHVSGFPDWKAALQFEWRWKQISRRQPSHMPPLERRLAALHALLLLDRPTSKAVEYSEWNSKPVVHVEDEFATFSLFLEADFAAYEIAFE